MSADQVPAVLSPCYAEPITSTITGRRCSRCHVLVTVVSLGGGCAVAYPTDPAGFVRDWNAGAFARDGRR
jgi:hypothetical protein